MVKFVERFVCNSQLYPVWSYGVTCTPNYGLYVHNTYKCHYNDKFVLGNTELNIVEHYKYLGIILNEFLDDDVTAQVLSDAANRALESVINKYKSINGLGYYTYTRLFQSGVCPILDYGCEIWGYKAFNKIDAIQNKAIRIYLGVHRFASTAAVSGDMGWTHSSVRRKVCMIRFWSRIVSLDNS